LSQEIELPAPPFDYSQAPSMSQPYSEYNLTISAEGYDGAAVSGVQILPDTPAEQIVSLLPTPEASGRTQGELFVIGPHTLYGDYPPKIPEDEIKPTSETGEIVLSRVVVPEYVIVHDGPPTDPSAANHWVLFRDYIKNVASSEIYATWPEQTIYANIYAILSFTLNRVYTEWYRNQGYNFTITSSTAFDHKWIRGRNIYTNIGLAVDNIFVNYLSRPNVRQPILTQYCDGNRTSCPNWMTQWGSKNLGDQGYTAIQILRNFYGRDMYINTAVQVSGVPQSWPGYNLNIGATGDNVRTIQTQLNRIAQVYTAIPTIAVDGIYGLQSAAAVRSFQQIFDLPVTGIVDLATWYKISQLYVAVTRIAEL
jgi:peptidoglycan hydrolase-like protein with peptidoglycan-binding domain